jgi:predicted nucleic acid-binding protein
VIYFDATFFVRLYIEENRFEEVRAVARTTPVISSSIIAKMETEAALHRHFREGKIVLRALQQANDQFSDDQQHELVEWLPLAPSIIERVHWAFLNLPASVYLRTGDAIHLATASEAGFKEIYSNDRHLLAAASMFKLKGVNPLAK